MRKTVPCVFHPISGVPPNPCADPGEDRAVQACGTQERSLGNARVWRCHYTNGFIPPRLPVPRVNFGATTAALIRRSQVWGKKTTWRFVGCPTCAPPAPIRVWCSRSLSVPLPSATKTRVWSQTSDMVRMTLCASLFWKRGFEISTSFVRINGQGTNKFTVQL